MGASLPKQGGRKQITDRNAIIPRMSKQHLELFLKELLAIRIACKGTRDGRPCSAVIEIPLDTLGGFFPVDACKCPWCGQSFYPAAEGAQVKNPFNPLAEALRALASIQDKASVTFVVDEPPS